MAATAKKSDRPAAARLVARRPTAGPGRDLVTRGLTPLLIVVVAALIVLPTTIVVTFALMPSLAALVADECRPRYLFRTVLGMNLAALWPYLEKLWFGSNDLGSAMAIVGDLYAWAAVYGSAGVGWLLYLSAPGIVVAWRKLNAERQIGMLKARQDALREEWGDALPGAEEEKKPAEEPAADAAAS